MARQDNHDAPYADVGPQNPLSIDTAARVISLSDVRNERLGHRSDRVRPEIKGTDPAGALASPPRSESPFHAVTDLDAIAAEPSFAVRRRRLAELMAAISGETPNERTLDHRMIATGMAAGHGCSAADPDVDAAWPLGSAMDDPAVVVGLVLHHAMHGAARGVPIPAAVKHALDHHVASGSAAARLVRDWWRMQSAPPARRRLQVLKGGKA